MVKRHVARKKKCCKAAKRGDLNALHESLVALAKASDECDDLMHGVANEALRSAAGYGRVAAVMAWLLLADGRDTKPSQMVEILRDTI